MQGKGGVIVPLESHFFAFNKCKHWLQWPLLWKKFVLLFRFCQFRLFKGRTIIFLEGGGGDENFFKTNNFFLCCCLCKQFFSGCIFLQTFFLCLCSCYYYYYYYYYYIYLFTVKIHQVILCSKNTNLNITA